jgi:anti-sigma factor RsiW
MRCPHALDSGAYVLGALAPIEREGYERHLADCATCREEVAELAVLPGLLGRLDAATAADVASGIAVAAPPKAPETVLPRTLWAAQAHRTELRRRGRWQTAATAVVAACLTLILSFGGWLTLQSLGGGSTPAMVAMRPVAAPMPVTAEVSLIPTGQGSRVRMHCAYHAEADRGRWMFRLYVYPRLSGEGEQISTWTAKYGDDFIVEATTRLAPGDIGRVELRRGDNVPLLVYEPD